MSNMGYVRFENTLPDLQDCFDHINDQNLSLSERAARLSLIELCYDIALETEYINDSWNDE